MHKTLSILLGAVILTACGGGSNSVSGGNGSRVDTIFINSAPSQALIDAGGPDGCTPEENNEQPSALLAYIPGDEPKKLVVFSHGYKQTVQVAWRHHMERIARRGVVSVAMNYRDNLGFPTLRGAQDLIQATLDAKQRFPSIEEVILFGVSMGGNISGTAIPESTAVTSDGSGLFDYWIAAEPLTNLLESYAEATAAQPETAAEMERDTGGNPATCPAAFQRRSPVLRTADIAAAGVKAVVVTHAVNDGLVPYNQSALFVPAMVAANVPTSFFTILRAEPGQDPGTVGTDLAGVPNIPNLAGHGWEGDEHHPVIRTAFEQLELMLNDEYDNSLPLVACIIDDPGTNSCGTTLPSF